MYNRPLPRRHNSYRQLLQFRKDDREAGLIYRQNISEIDNTEIWSPVYETSDFRVTLNGKLQGDK